MNFPKPSAFPKPSSFAPPPLPSQVAQAAPPPQTPPAPPPPPATPPPAGSAASAPPPTTAAGALDNDTKMWGMFCHLAALSGLVGIGIGHLVGPLVIWLIKRNDHPFMDAQGKAALNFQISMTIYGAVAGLLCFVLIGFVLLPAVVVMDLICTILASVKASEGGSYQYPLAIKFLQ